MSRNISLIFNMHNPCGHSLYCFNHFKCRYEDNMAIDNSSRSSIIINYVNIHTRHLITTIIIQTITIQTHSNKWMMIIITPQINFLFWVICTEFKKYFHLFGSLIHIVPYSSQPCRKRKKIRIKVFSYLTNVIHQRKDSHNIDYRRAKMKRDINKDSVARQRDVACWEDAELLNPWHSGLSLWSTHCKYRTALKKMERYLGKWKKVPWYMSDRFKYKHRPIWNI